MGNGRVQFLIIVYRFNDNFVIFYNLITVLKLRIILKELFDRYNINNVFIYQIISYIDYTFNWRKIKYVIHKLFIIF